MTIAEIQKFCKSLPGVTEDIKWDDHLCFNIGGKLFLVTAPDAVPISASFKVTDELFASLPERQGVIPAPYMARHKWVLVDDLNRFSEKEWQQFIHGSYSLILEKLSAKFKKSIASDTM